MPIAIQIGLTVGPLATYCFLLGLWQSGRDPKVIPGAIDLGLLVFGLGGLVAFGPVGKVLIQALFPAPSLWAHLVIPTALALGSLLMAPRGHRRLIVYNTDPEALERAIQEAISALPDGLGFARTLRGFEDAKSRRGLLLDASPRGRTAVIEGFGDHPEALVSAIAPRLRDRLRGTGRIGSRLSRFCYAMAILAICIPTLAVVFSREPIQSAWRGLLGRIFGK